MGPSLRLDAVRAQLVALPIEPGGGAPALDTVVHFASGSSQLQLELSLPITDPQQQFVLHVAATEQGIGDTIYIATDTVRLTTGDTPVPIPLAMRYAGRDTLVATVGVAPRDTMLVVGDSVQLRAAAFRTGQQAPLTGVRFGWAIGDSASASVSSTGMLKVTRAVTGMWIYAGTANGVLDSARVSAYVPVRRVDLSPPTAHVAVGDTIVLTATTFDRDGAVLTGRTVTFQSLDTTATVLGTGRVIGRAPGVARVVAASEGVADTSVVTVVPQPVASVTLTPDTVKVARGDSLDLPQPRGESRDIDARGL